MNVRVRLYGTLAHHGDPETPNETKIALSSEARIRDLITALQLEPKEVAVVVVNGKICCPEDIIPEDVEVLKTSVVGGGLAR